MQELEPHAILMILVFFLGYLCITLEHFLRIDKATIALLTCVALWTIQFVATGAVCEVPSHCLMEELADISQIIFFLLGALVIVELISAHKGFAIIANAIRIRSKRQLLWVVGLLAFFLSAILDNLTTTIVLVTLLSKLIEKNEDRMLIGGAVVIAANAGGAWTPIGDVTTTMLWIGGQLSSFAVIKALFLPSIISLLTALGVFSLMLRGRFAPVVNKVNEKQVEPLGELIFALGVGCLIFVPIFKMLTGLPPFMGVLLGVAVLWLVTDLLHTKHNKREHLLMPSIFKEIDIATLLFFLGILLAVAALNGADILTQLARWLDTYIVSPGIIATLIGLASAVVDNVPLVAASMGMYTSEQFPKDHPFWQLVAFCAGTGGSILVIGSAAGVVYMALERVNFFWYCKRIALPALISYFIGIGSYFLLSRFT